MITKTNMLSFLNHSLSPLSLYISLSLSLSLSIYLSHTRRSLISRSPRVGENVLAASSSSTSNASPRKSANLSSHWKTTKFSRWKLITDRLWRACGHWAKQIETKNKKKKTKFNFTGPQQLDHKRRPWLTHRQKEEEEEGRKEGRRDLITLATKKNVSCSTWFYEIAGFTNCQFGQRQVQNCIALQLSMKQL